MQQPQPQRELDDRQSLRDLDGIYVDVTDLPPLVITQGLSAERLKEDVEERLRRAGVEVLPMGHFRTGDPHVQIAIRVSEPQGRLVASHVEVTFMQICFLRRNPIVTFNRARTWTATSALVLGQVGQLAATIRRDLTSQIDQFVAALRAVNP